jgi:hypothetical protein
MCPLLLQLLQNPVDVEGMQATDPKRMYPSPIVLPDSSAQSHSVSHSARALPRAHSEAARPSSYATMAHSLLSSSFSWEGATLVARWPLREKETEPCTNQKAKTSVMTKKPTQASVRIE